MKPIIGQRETSGIARADPSRNDAPRVEDGWRSSLSQRPSRRIRTRSVCHVSWQPILVHTYILRHAHLADDPYDGQRTHDGVSQPATPKYRCRGVENARRFALLFSTSFTYVAFYEFARQRYTISSKYEWISRPRLHPSCGEPPRSVGVILTVLFYWYTFNPPLPVCASLEFYFLALCMKRGMHFGMHINLLSPARVISVWETHTRDLGMPSLSQLACTRRGKCDAFTLYIVLTRFRGDAYWDAASQWRLGFGPSGSGAKKGRCDDNCVFNGASYTLRTYTWLPKVSWVGFTKIDVKASLVDLFFVH